MKIDLRYTEHNFREKPQRVGKCFNFNTGETLPGRRIRKHYITIPWGKRYFDAQKCIPPTGIKIKASSVREIREHNRINCCASCR